MNEYPKALLEYLEKNKHIQTIYFNSNGDYVFRPSKLHLMSKTRAQVMGTGKAPKETKEVNDKK